MRTRLRREMTPIINRPLQVKRMLLQVSLWIPVIVAIFAVNFYQSSFPDKETNEVVSENKMHSLQDALERLAKLVAAQQESLAKLSAAQQDSLSSQNQMRERMAESIFTDSQKLYLFETVAPSIVKLVVRRQQFIDEGTGFALTNHSSGEVLFVTANHVGRCNETVISRHIFVNTSLLGRQPDL